MKQIHKKFSSEQVKEILSKYESGNVKREIIQEILGIGRSRFFELIRKYRFDKENFSVFHTRQHFPRQIKNEYDEYILKELEISKKLIENPKIPTTRYNYSYSSKEIKRKHGVEISIPTIINRAKKWGYYKERHKSHKVHDRVVYTNSIGELIQHDSSYHLFAPLSSKKWYLITSIDDFSRLLLEARFIEAESSVEHIKSLERVFTNHGFPYSYYTDSHSIFRFVAGRDDMLLHKSYSVPTDGVDTQWLQVLKDCGVQKRNALSPQAKGKVERPYQWIQDHVVRRCMSDNVVKLTDGQQILNEEVKFYNYKRLHSTTGEVPWHRFKKALKEGNSLWRSFTIPKPFVSKKDIFSLRLNRRADGYRIISLNNFKFKVNGLNPYDNVNIRIYKLSNETSELRFWRNERLLDTQLIKNSHLKDFHP